MARRTSVIALVLVAFATVATRAMYVQVQVENVPVERLIANLEQLIAQKPADAGLRLNLARVHGMAYARKTETVPIWKGNEGYGVWFGHEQPLVPHNRVVASTDPQKLAAAKAHLEKAIAAFDEAIKLSETPAAGPPHVPAHLIAKLGRAWAIEQTGDKAKAIAAYREVLALAWQTEGQMRGAPLGGHTVTGEGAGYLIPLLDPERDKAEIATLKSRADQVGRLPRPVTPIAIPLRDDMTVWDVVDHAARVTFDADGSGLRRQWTWIAPDAGWLVYDQRGTRQIDSALQMFGSVTFWLFWDHGYQALGALDDDGDGSLRGRELAHLAIWRDGNRNGLSERGEVAPLTAWNIVSLSCAYEIDDDGASVASSTAGVTFTDGRSRPTWDVLLYPMSLRSHP
jgi:hypothetical protein